MSQIGAKKRTTYTNIQRNTQKYADCKEQRKETWQKHVKIRQNMKKTRKCAEHTQEIRRKYAKISRKSKTDLVQWGKHENNTENLNKTQKKHAKLSIIMKDLSLS